MTGRVLLRPSERRRRREPNIHKVLLRDPRGLQGRRSRSYIRFRRCSGGDARLPIHQRSNYEPLRSEGGPGWVLLHAIHHKVLAALQAVVRGPGHALRVGGSRSLMLLPDDMAALSFGDGGAGASSCSCRLGP